MGARYYQPELGRWTQPDPSGQEANAYLYVGGNPANFVDPSGLSFLGIDCPFGETDTGGCNGADDAAGALDAAKDVGEGALDVRVLPRCPKAVRPGDSQRPGRPPVPRR